MHARLMRMTAMASLLLAPSAAWAGPGTLGVGLNAAPLVVPAPVPPGQRAAASVLAVRNTGTTPLVARLAGVPVPHPVGHRSPAPPSWLRVTPSTVTLTAGQTGRASVSVAVPQDAPAGAYVGFVEAVAAGTPQSAGGGNGTGVAVQAEVFFQVPASPSLRVGGTWPVGTTGRLLVALVCVGAVWVALRRSGLRIQVTRRAR